MKDSHINYDVKKGRGKTFYSRQMTALSHLVSVSVPGVQTALYAAHGHHTESANREN